MMLIIETAIFTKRVNELLDDEQYRLLQWILVKAPGSGKIIPGRNEQTDLAAQQLKKLRLVVQRELREKGTV